MSGRTKERLVVLSLYAKKILGNRLLLDRYIQNSSCNNNTNVLNQLNSPLAIAIVPQNLVNFFGENRKFRTSVLLGLYANMTWF
ncbi:MAG: hypothetical protein M3Y53_00265, partial [Thermoproteota archaeon]|nr:hypothetical protein [Thermoproteota archaeon]